MVLTSGQTVPAPIRFGENMRITVAATQGGRRYMEDRCVIHTERGENGILKWTFVGVFDGHGGEQASEYVRRHLLMNITKCQKFESEDDEDILEAIRQGFLMTHEEMRHVYEEWPYTASGYPSTAGTTVSCVFIRNGKLYTGHVGDSAIFLGTVENGTLYTRALTVDHKPESVPEQIRIAKSGGETAVKSGITRVIWKRPAKHSLFLSPSTQPPVMEAIPFLSVARSLGDLWSFNEATNMFVVSPEPDLGIHHLTGNDFCLVLASDGMTNVLTGKQAISIVFKEEELVEIQEEINRNHSRCVLRSTLQKWRTLRADNVTVATVIFDIDPLSYTENEMLMKVGRYVNASQVLTDRPDAMLKVSKTENILLSTQRTPVIYNGSKDTNFCRVTYRGPGFRTHEEELLEERRNIMSKFADSAIGVAGATTDARRGTGIQEKIAQNTKNDVEEDVEYDDYDEEEEDDGLFDPSEEIDLNLKLTEKSDSSTVESSHVQRPQAPRPSIFIDDSIIEEANNEDSKDQGLPGNENGGVQMTPIRSPLGPTVRRVKAEAVRRLRTPKITSEEVSSTSLSSSTTPNKVEPVTSPDRRITRSVSRILEKMEKCTPVKSPASRGGRQNEGSIIGVNTNLSPDAVLAVTPRRSTRLLNVGSGPCSPSSAKLTTSRKRGRLPDDQTGVTPVVASLRLKPEFHPFLSNSLAASLASLQFPAPSQSAPSTPKKAEKILKSSKFLSLSQLEESKKNAGSIGGGDNVDGIVRVSEVADEEEDDVMREPPSKIRRFYGYMRKMFWGK